MPCVLLFIVFYMYSYCIFLYLCHDVAAGTSASAVVSTETPLRNITSLSRSCCLCSAMMQSLLPVNWVTSGTYHFGAPHASSSFLSSCDRRKRKSSQKILPPGTKCTHFSVEATFLALLLKIVVPVHKYIPRVQMRYKRHHRCVE